MHNERVRHAKRLGHVQGWSGPTNLVLANKNAATTTTSDTSTVTTSETSTTSAKQATSTSTQVVSTSSSTSSVSSATTSTIPTLSTIEITSTSPTLQSTTPQIATTLTNSSPPPPPPPTSDSSQQLTDSPSGGLSAGATVGIVVAGIIAAVALLAFCVRKTYLRRRERRRASLSGIYGFGAANESSKLPHGVPGLSEKTFGSGTQDLSSTLRLGAGDRTAYAARSDPSVFQQKPGVSPSAHSFPAPPAASYNNPVLLTPPDTTRKTAALTAARAAALSGSGPNALVYSATTQPELPVAVIRCTFVPTLPDELSITTGELVRVVDRFDDGWALCENGRGERGMIPQECLTETTTDSAMGDTDWRNATRMSSLNPHERRF